MNLDEAERMVKLALQIRPASGYITDSLGWIYFKQGKKQLALTTLLERKLSRIRKEAETSPRR